MTMDVLIFGIGCSGTTMTYGLLQSIYSDLYKTDFFSTYEPFIWDKQKFNLPYEQAGNLFGKTTSISIEGIYNHIKTPMFIDHESCRAYLKNEFFRHFSLKHGPGQPHLIKLIRGNGRMHLFRALNPKAKFLLVIRNPVDNINCAKYKFSFFGDDFYPSDFPRFCEEIGNEDTPFFDQCNAGWPQRQAEYCYQMNRMALDFAENDSNTEILEYDSFVQNLAFSVKGLCEFLNTPFRDRYVEELQQPTGPITASNALSQSEYEAIFPYDDLYSELCERAGVVRGKNRSAIKDQYGEKCKAENVNTEHSTSTTNRLRGVIRMQEEQIRLLKQRIESK